MRKIILICLILASIATVTYSVVRFGYAERLVSVFKPNYIELTKDQLLTLNKEQLATIAENSINGHKEAIALWEGSLKIFSCLLLILSINIALAVVVAVAFGWKGSNKSLKNGTREELRAP